MGLFVEDARKIWRRWSVQFSLLAGALTAYATSPAGYSQVQALIVYIPDRWRPLASLALGFMVAMVPPFLVALKQPKLGGNDNG